MLLCGVCFFKSKLPYLEKIGVKDSKKLTPEKRSNLTKLIKSSCVAYKELEISVKQIDDRELKRISLNQLEIKMMAEIINDLKPDIIFIDAADTNEKRFGELIRTILNYDPQKIISKHKADDLFPIVSAASIIAKTKRDKIINELREEYINKGYGDMGSGYTSDEKTVKFLREWIKTYKHIPPFARKTWETTKRIANQELYNRKITHYF
ncbi:MAG: ribonuclease HII [Candidatus Lokiarchaeota archaeon]|nr:ribonuclease HII [Candidatus Lokiarchaeota archaeon]MBD3202229.1 ribonuclease HII [Candidatus Lokiarchaeota archaeon]